MTTAPMTQNEIKAFDLFMKFLRKQHVPVRELANGEIEVRVRHNLVDECYWIWKSRRSFLFGVQGPIVSPDIPSIHGEWSLFKVVENAYAARTRPGSWSSDLGLKAVTQLIPMLAAHHLKSFS